MLNERKANKGFGLVEILVTIGVLAVGIMGVAAFHTVVTKQSLDNKTRTEALGIAQSRIEEMRNYTDSAATLTQFDTVYGDTTGFENSTTINGVSSVFTRDETITSNGNLKSIIVRVSWTDPEGTAQSLNLDTDIGFLSPRSAGDAAQTASAPKVNAPTGRARLGEGTLPEGADTTSNDDGTSLFQDGGEDLRLVSDDQIVLTLALACQTDDGTCIDFVKIKGRVYIDTSSQNINPGEVFVVASDAAFCARYYTDPDDGMNYKVTIDTTSTVTTASGDYEYFDYTCYLGGGWHGIV
ncbi:MAG: prepilin-type N-terminal cleavage/methylation domain-containing protein, partial [Pseudohongiellaceae bacterium]